MSLGLQSIVASPEEYTSGQLSPSNLARALAIMEQDGLLMIQNAVDPAHLDALNEQMVKDAWALWDGGFRKGAEETGNIQIDPPLIPELFFEDCFLNRLATCVTTAYLGGKPRMTFNSGNAAMHGTLPQPTHSDYGNFSRVPVSPFACVINTPLIPTSPQNGATEVWLGTHRVLRNSEAADGAVVKGPGVGEDRKIRPERKEARMREAPGKGPLQPEVPKGALLVRDLRLWHGGMPNHGHKPRIMLAQIHFAPGYRNPMQIRMPVSLREAVERRKEELEVSVEWEEGEVDHLRTTTEHTFNFLEREETNVDLREMRRGRWAAPMVPDRAGAGVAQVQAAA